MLRSSLMVLLLLGSANGPQAGPRIDLLIERADAGACKVRGRSGAETKALDSAPQGRT